MFDHKVLAQTSLVLFLEYCVLSFLNSEKLKIHKTLVPKDFKYAIVDFNHVWVFFQFTLGRVKLQLPMGSSSVNGLQAVGYMS